MLNPNDYFEYAKLVSLVTLMVCKDQARFSHTQKNAIIGIINTGNPVCLENASSSRFGAWWIKFEQNVTFLPKWDNTQTPGTNLAGTIYPGRGTRTASWHRKPRSRRSSGPFGPRSYPDSAERNPCPGWIIWKWEAKQANIKKKPENSHGISIELRIEIELGNLIWKRFV